MRSLAHKPPTPITVLSLALRTFPRNPQHNSNISHKDFTEKMGGRNLSRNSYLARILHGANVLAMGDGCSITALRNFARMEITMFYKDDEQQPDPVQPIKVLLALSVAEASALLARMDDDFTPDQAELVTGIQRRLRAMFGFAPRTVVKK